MTCIVLVKNPNGGGVLAITEDDGESIAQWPTAKEAQDAIANHSLVKAWGGYVVDLDYLEVGTV